MAHKEIDHATGVETTGHVWDGDLKELNKPLPKWWLYSFYVSIIWAIGYFIVYPAWPVPGGYTHGIWNWSSRATAMAEVKAGKAAQAANYAKLEKTALADVRKDPELLRFAMTGGKSAFDNNCAPCHRVGGAGAIGYPALGDDDWLWGGKIEDIQTTIEHGIRSADDKKTRDSAMPKFGIDKMLDDKAIADTAEYVLSLSGKSTDKDAVARGAKLFADNCTACHGADGKGNQDLGAPNLTDNIWLYGSSKAAVIESISTGRGGMMPAWGPTQADPKGRLDQVTIKSLAVYVHSLGGGKQ